MIELKSTDLGTISGGVKFSSWQTIGVGMLASAISFAFIDGMPTLSRKLAFQMGCGAIYGTLTTGAIVGTINIGNHLIYSSSSS